MRKLITAVSTTAILLASTPLAFASVFPDVPDGYMYQEEIEMLVGAQVINGNPDGSFKPERGVNRAEMLKMLYKAKGKIPDAASKGCFKDVGAGSWYEMYVCDAAANRYVQGYSDGTFRPATLVNRVEALKMIMEIFDVNVEEITEARRDIVKFVDVSTAAWYTKYLYAGFDKGILPIIGQEGARFFPNWPLLRGEAAAYIFNSLHVQLDEERAETEDQTQTQSQTEGEDTSNGTTDSSSDTDDSGSGGRDSSYQDPVSTATNYNVDFPFTKSGKFKGRRLKSYSFDLSRTQDVYIVAALQSGQIGKVSCRIYRLKDDGFSTEYYLGYQEGRKCYLKVALSRGNYQLDVQPTSKDTTYTVFAEETSGDGNDGFREAALFAIGLNKTDILDSHDYADFYRFTVQSEKNLTLDVANQSELSCLIYPMEDVDLYGFSGPTCNHSYKYPPGTYYVSVGRKKPRSSRQTYTIQLQ
ncbi:MAG: S-layer homology domain-containing protein [Candidatus Peribacteraceae bacterium]|nr:S-layer homology domain-containing protein [Candidatus Peribacteraceae bacterium]